MNNFQAGIFETLEDLFDLISSFFDTIGDFIVSSLGVGAALTQFIVKSVSFIISLYPLMPSFLQIIMPITLILTIILLVLGRSNNNG
ncbi:MAG: hypothetical protein IJO29_00270 [Oscillospiraceae bacterium]|nr:hypothetical protein [Oscillospiraceae bacterium]